MHSTWAKYKYTHFFHFKTFSIFIRNAWLHVYNLRTVYLRWTCNYNPIFQQNKNKTCYTHLVWWLIITIILCKCTMYHDDQCKHSYNDNACMYLYFWLQIKVLTVTTKKVFSRNTKFLSLKRLFWNIFSSLGINIHV